METHPDPFIRYEYPKLLDESRVAAAQLLSVPTDTVVFVSNCSTGVSTVLHNLQWDDDCKDEILYFNTIYSACAKTIDYVVESRYSRVSSQCINLTYPCEDDEILSAFSSAVAASKQAGKRPKVCIFDVVSSLPGMRFPFEAMTAACRAAGILSLVDGAHGIGMVDLDLGNLDPDFFISNCHKWLHVPRGCAVFYVPFRNQELIRTTLPTSHGYVPRLVKRNNPFPPTTKSPFVYNFEFAGTIDSSPFLCVKDAIQWRKDVLGGEERIRKYQRKLAVEGGKRVAEILGTEILQNKAGTLTDCSMVNIALPLSVGPNPEQESATGKEQNAQAFPVIPFEEMGAMCQWLERTLVSDYNAYLPVYIFNNRLWTRMSAQVYLEQDDFEWAGHTLKELCERAAANAN